MTANTLELKPLTDFVGAEVVGLDADRLSFDTALAADIVTALEANGVLIFRDVNLSAEQQIAFAEKLGDVDYFEGHHPVAGIYRVSLDKSKNSAADYLHATFHWHIDGCTPEGDECPQKATILSAQSVSETGGETEFASTYAAYDDLSDEERARFEGVTAVYSLEASQRLTNPEPTDEQLERWRGRKTSEFPMVWTHRDGRRSLVIGASADHIVGMDPDESRAVLDDLLHRATRPDRVYRHSWHVGDMVIWDNRGVLHRAVPYDEDSPREMLRTTVLGDEPIQ